MADGTSIEWTDATWNPVSGCTRISEGCQHCYIARTPPLRMAGRRFDGPEIGATTGVLLHPDRLTHPLRWRKPRRIFVCSMADLFHDAVPDEYIARVWAVMAAAPQHTFQVLTKRPARMRTLLRSSGFDAPYFEALVEMPGGKRIIDEQRVPWPIPNVWVGVSTEDQETADRRIPILLDTPAAVRWVSAEPLLGPVDLRIIEDVDGCTCGQGDSGFPHEPRCGADRGRHYGIDWVVAGGESGPSARPMHPAWVRSLRDQCQDAGVPVLFKQWGEWGPAEWKPARAEGEDAEAYKARAEATGATHAFPGTAYMRGGRLVHSFIPLDHKPWSAERSPQAPPAAAGMRRWGKKHAGRVLDGRTWDEYPQAVSRG